MKNSKLILLLIILFSLTGCTFEYNIEINTNRIKESNIIYIDNATKDTIKQEVEELVDSYTGPTNGLGMYTQSIVNSNNRFGMLYEMNYSKIEDYNDSISVSSCYDNYKLIKEEDKIIISTSKEFKCFDNYKELDDVIVNIKSNLDVLSSNADEVNGNVYTWNITKDNANNKAITISLKPNTDKVERKKEMDVLLLVIFAFTLFGIIVLLLRLRSKRKNKI